MLLGGPIDMRLVIGCCACLILLVGCRSLNSTFLMRNEENSGWSTVKHLPGVPITLKVPTHLRLAVIERHFLKVDGNGVQYVPVPVVIRDVNTEFLKTEKIFTVDLKRPAAGTAKSAIEFDSENDEQYFKKITQEIEDKTIDAVSNLVGKLAPKGVFANASSGGGVAVTSTETLKVVDSIVAVQVFEIDAPDFEQSIREFLDCHINKAHDGFVLPEGVKELKRPAVLNDLPVDPLFCPNCPPGVSTPVFGG